MGAKNTSKAQGRLISCEKCDQFVITPFKSLLEELAQEFGITENGVLVPARCPACSEVVKESTLVSYRRGSCHGLSDADYFDPPLEDSTVRLVDEPVRAAAQSMIAGCEYCSDCTDVSFECILDQITGCNPTLTEYLLFSPAQCPRCNRDVTERTLVIPREILR